MGSGSQVGAVGCAGASAGGGGPHAHAHGTLVALIGALREPVKASGGGRSGGGGGDGTQLPLSTSGVVLPLLPVLATLGQAGGDGKGLPLATLKVGICGCITLSCMPTHCSI